MSKVELTRIAKQYHPDRNPGREVECVPRFQAIQAAHEILGDPTQKAKYDAERAKLQARDVVSPTFKKPQPPRRTDSGYANGPFPQPGQQQRRDPSATRYAPQSTPRSRPTSATSTADKFAQFARAAPQQWDRTKFEQAAAQEGLRGMNAMRGAPTSPLRPRQHPTAPKDPYSSGGEPSPGYPGLNRTASQRRNYPPESAYSHVYGSDRERPTGTTYSHVDPTSRVRESVSPLRQTKSFQNDGYSHLRPGLSRTSSRYAQAGGERTTLNTGVGRSASVRASPVENKWEDNAKGAFGNYSPAEDRTPRPRHRSHSPNRQFEYGSETSSDEDDIPLPQERKKATLRRPQTHAPNSSGPGLTGYFPGTNYTRIVEDGASYDYPAPDMKGPPTRKPFTNVSPLDNHDHNANEPPFSTPGEEASSKQYVPPSAPRRGYPNWFIPSSVCPKTILPTIHEAHDRLNNALNYAMYQEMPFANVSDSSSSNDGQPDSRFNPREWHEHFDDHADLFKPNPTETTRKSPAKGFRTSQRGQRPTTTNRRDSLDSEHIAAGVRHVDSKTKAAAFQAGKLAPDFAAQVNGGRRSSRSGATSGSEMQNDRPISDEMDVDSPAPPSTESTNQSDASYNVTVEEDGSPQTSPRQHVHRHHSDPQGRSNGFNLNDLKASMSNPQQGLKDLGDLNDSLPFKSQPSANPKEALAESFAAAVRKLALPHPPPPPVAPADIDASSWKRYGDAMTHYMHEWNKFNATMIEHFRARQEDVTHGMYRNWVCAQGDGASASDFDKKETSERAGYATYVQWLEDDRTCRVWWEVSIEDHRRAVEELGKVRRVVKGMNAKSQIA